MSTSNQRIVSIYTESTPNPETMKFVVNSMLFARNTIDFRSAEDVKGNSPLADKLFGLDFIKSVFIANNFITIGRKPGMEWIEIIPQIKEQIKTFLASDEDVISKEYIAAQEAEAAANTDSLDGEEGDIVAQIKDMLAKYVQPAVEMDGGSIVFRSYQEGIVTLGMQGACSGCPSSTITLKAGIEGMMKRMIPEVQEVVAEAM